MWRDTEEEKEEQVGSKPALDHREPVLPQSTSECFLFNRDESLGSCWAQFCLVELNLYCCVPCGGVLHWAKNTFCRFCLQGRFFFSRCAFKKFKGHLETNETGFFI